jgi:hypothetical protein
MRVGNGQIAGSVGSRRMMHWSVALDRWKEKVHRRAATRLAEDGHMASNVTHEGADLGHA